MDKHTRKRKKRERSLLLVKKVTGDCVHVFDEMATLEIITAEDRHRFIEEATIKNQASRLYQQVKELTVEQTWITIQPWSDFKAYRGVWGATLPLDMTGTVACGGRLNVGGAQVCYSYDSLCARASSGLYMSDSIDTVFAELGLPSPQSAPGLKLPTLYELKKTSPGGELRLFDLDTVVADLGSKIISAVPIQAMFDASPISAEWKLQKTPAPIQLLAQWLRASGLADGISARSVKKPDGLNFFLFFDSMNSPQEKLSAVQVRIAQKADHDGRKIFQD